MSESSSQSMRKQSPEQRARLLRVALGLLVTVALVVIPLVTPGTLGRFTAAVNNTANSGTVMPFFSCREALTKETGRVFAYQFNETRPTNLVDGSNSSTASSYVTPRNTATACKHDTVGYLEFAGNTKSPSIVRNTTSVTPPQTYTQELWFQSTGTQGNLMALTNNDTYPQELKFDRELYVGASGKLNMSNYVSATGGFERVQSPATVADGKWHHVVATRDPAAGFASVYLDGVLVGSTPATGTLETYSPARWRIGCARVDSWPDAPAKSAECFKGNIGFAAVYNRGFTQQDVTNHYKAGVWGP
ncbi:hypothetical protein CWC38_00020 [Kocuria tytonicola]|uniref:LamG domain-containing protein n=1 Tax=Kocuria tytonicola TaxID=2055946 RepID=A0A3L9M031_9MICC|nr:LamG domain-containing protein [Kocuria tytonicola]RLY93727.1 LamG domain-containing protein [Kocuria tytonicola]RLZ04456.1 hypothetical protein CWC38_00020 [Kocuria tytonicola]